MKLLLPILNQLEIESGFAIRNPQVLKNLKDGGPARVQLWKDFHVINEVKIEFQKKPAVRIYLKDLFPDFEIKQATLATVGFSNLDFSEVDQKNLFPSAFEAQCLFRSKHSNSWTSVLYDLIPDKKPGHTYAPILHSGHAAYFDQDIDCYSILVNHRPQFLMPAKLEQEMNIQIKSPSGEVKTQKIIQIPFNHTTLFSYREFFPANSDFELGSSMNFKGGESQFAIFTLFRNVKTQALGIEHSLAPLYYCSGVRDNKTRSVFYKNAFSDVRNNL